MDKKSDHYTSAKNYTDLDGQSKSFTFIDHDKKTKVSTGKVTKKELAAIKDANRAYKKFVIENILDIPASICPYEYQDFTVRGEGVSAILWNESMIRDEGLDIVKLTSLLNILENRLESKGLI